MKSPVVTGFHEPRTGSVQYVVACTETDACAIIDPVLDFDEKSGSVATRSADTLLAFVAARGLTPEWILDTHPHADHFSAAHYLRGKTSARSAIGNRVVEVQKLWGEIYNWPHFEADGRQWDRLLRDGEEFRIGGLTARVMASPGHTLASISYLIGDAAFIHDTLFMPDSGTARADFPGGSAKALWASIQAILALPAHTRLFTGHDYAPNGRRPAWESSIAEQKSQNEMVAGVASEREFIAVRERKDRSLPLPKQMLAALQVNINGGRLPEAEGNGTSYLKIPLDTFKGSAWD